MENGIGDLLTEDKNGEFRLAKYFVSYLKIKNNQDFADGDLKDFIICTNIDFDLDQDTAQNAVKKLKMQTIKKIKEKKFGLKQLTIVMSSLKMVARDIRFLIIKMTSLQ